MNEEWVGRFSRAWDPHRDIEEYAKPSPEILLIIQSMYTLPPPYPRCPLQEIHHWVIELSADGTIPTIFNLKAICHKSKQTIQLPGWLMQCNTLIKMNVNGSSVHHRCALTAVLEHGELRDEIGLKTKSRNSSRKCCRLPRCPHQSGHVLHHYNCVISSLMNKLNDFDSFIEMTFGDNHFFRDFKSVVSRSITRQSINVCTAKDGKTALLRVEPPQGCWSPHSSARILLNETQTGSTVKAL